MLIVADVIACLGLLYLCWLFVTFGRLSLVVLRNCRIGVVYVVAVCLMLCLDCFVPAVCLLVVSGICVCLLR